MQRKAAHLAYKHPCRGVGSCDPESHIAQIVASRRARWAELQFVDLFDFVRTGSSDERFVYLAGLQCSWTSI